MIHRPYVNLPITYKNRSQRNLSDTYMAPPPAGPAALNRDIKVIAMPLAAPLWS